MRRRRTSRNSGDPSAQTADALRPIEAVIVVGPAETELAGLVATPTVKLAIREACACVRVASYDLRHAGHWQRTRCPHVGAIACAELAVQVPAAALQHTARTPRARVADTIS